MILLLGASGYIGQAFVAELQRRRLDFRPASRQELDYTCFDPLFDFLQKHRPAFVINAAGFTGKPNVDACEVARAETLLGNALLPQTIAQACSAADIPFGHVSSGCIFAGGKVKTHGQIRVEKDLMRPDLRARLSSAPDDFHGFAETDEPNFSFRQPPCSFYSGSKALGEEALRGVGKSYIWRLRIPFDEQDGERNYLSKIQRYRKVYENANSISHRTDYVRACLDLWERRAPFGIYNVTNPGFITTRQVVELIQTILKPKRAFEFWANDAEFYEQAARTPRSNCLLDTSKLLATGVKVRPVRDALVDALERWIPA